MSEFPELNSTNIGTFASIAGFILSLLIFFKSKSIVKEISIVKSRIILKKRLPEMLESLNSTLGNINKLLIEIEINETKIKDELIKCQSIVISLLSKIDEGEIIRDLNKMNKSISILKKKYLVRDPKKIKIFKQFFAQYRLWPYAYECNLLSVKRDLSKIYNDLHHFSLDQKEI